MNELEPPTAMVLLRARTEQWKRLAKDLRVNLRCANANWEHCLVAIRERDEKLSRLEAEAKAWRDAHGTFGPQTPDEVRAILRKRAGEG